MFEFLNLLLIGLDFESLFYEINVHHFNLVFWLRNSTVMDLWNSHVFTCNDTRGFIGCNMKNFTKQNLLSSLKATWLDNALKQIYPHGSI